MPDHGIQYVPPVLRPESEFFWRSGHDGRLRLLGCDACAYLIHPPAPYCPRCGARETTPVAVSGLATVYTFTVNHQAWTPDAEPYAIAVVVPDEQEDLRLTTRLVECDPAAVRIGMRVEAVLHPVGEVWLPLFRPLRAA